MRTPALHWCVAPGRLKQKGVVMREVTVTLDADTGLRVKAEAAARKTTASQPGSRYPDMFAGGFPDNEASERTPPVAASAGASVPSRG